MTVQGSTMSNFTKGNMIPHLISTVLWWDTTLLVQFTRATLCTEINLRVAIGGDGDS